MIDELSICQAPCASEPLAVSAVVPAGSGQAVAGFCTFGHASPLTDPRFDVEGEDENGRLPHEPGYIAPGSSPMTVPDLFTPVPHRGRRRGPGRERQGAAVVRRAA